jgi:hypothetical protein
MNQLLRNSTSFATASILSLVIMLIASAAAGAGKDESLVYFGT